MTHWKVLKEESESPKRSVNAALKSCGEKISACLPHNLSFISLLKGGALTKDTNWLKIGFAALIYIPRNLIGGAFSLVRYQIAMQSLKRLSSDDKEELPKADVKRIYDEISDIEASWGSDTVAGGHVDKAPWEISKEINKTANKLKPGQASLVEIEGFGSYLVVKPPNNIRQESTVYKKLSNLEVESINKLSRGGEEGWALGNTGYQVKKVEEGYLSVVTINNRNSASSNSTKSASFSSDRAEENNQIETIATASGEIDSRVERILNLNVNKESIKDGEARFIQMEQSKDVYCAFNLLGDTKGVQFVLLEGKEVPQMQVNELRNINLEEGEVLQLESKEKGKMGARILATKV